MLLNIGVCDIMTTYEEIKKNTNDKETFKRLKEYFDTYKDENNYLEEKLEMEREKKLKQKTII